MRLTPTHGLSAAHVLLQYRCHCLHAGFNALGGNRRVAQAHAGAVVGRCGVKERAGFHHHANSVQVLCEFQRIKGVRPCDP